MCRRYTNIPRTAEVSPTIPTTGLEPDHRSSISEEYDSENLRLAGNHPRHHDTER